MSMTSGLSALLCEHFAGKVVRKDLTKKIKEGANVPTYVLEYLLGMYCATDDEASIAEGIERVKSILAENFVRPDEAEKIKSKIREIGSYTVIDKLEARLDPEHDNYKCVFSNLNIKNVVIADSYVKKFEKLLSGGIWCILRMSYSRLEERYEDEDEPKQRGKKDRISPFEIDELTPIQLPNMDMDELFEGRGHFTKDEWIDVLVRSSGLEPTQMETRVKWHILERMVPLAENNYSQLKSKP
jgi:ATP-dependent Lon protease